MNRINLTITAVFICTVLFCCNAYSSEVPQTPKSSTEETSTLSTSANEEQEITKTPSQINEKLTESLEKTTSDESNVPKTETPTKESPQTTATEGDKSSTTTQPETKTSDSVMKLNVTGKEYLESNEKSQETTFKTTAADIENKHVIFTGGSESVIKNAYSTTLKSTDYTSSETSRSDIENEIDVSSTGTNLVNEVATDLSKSSVDESTGHVTESSTYSKTAEANESKLKVTQNAISTKEDEEATHSTAKRSLRDKTETKEVDEKMKATTEFEDLSTSTSGSMDINEISTPVAENTAINFGSTTSKGSEKPVSEISTSAQKKSETSDTATESSVSPTFSTETPKVIEPLKTSALIDENDKTQETSVKIVATTITNRVEQATTIIPNNELTSESTEKHTQFITESELGETMAATIRDSIPNKDTAMMLADSPVDSATENPKVYEKDNIKATKINKISTEIHSQTDSKEITTSDVPENTAIPDSITKTTKLSRGQRHSPSSSSSYTKFSTVDPNGTKTVSSDFYKEPNSVVVTSKVFVRPLELLQEQTNPVTSSQMDLNSGIITNSGLTNTDDEISTTQARELESDETMKISETVQLDKSQSPSLASKDITDIIPEESNPHISVVTYPSKHLELENTSSIGSESSSFGLDYMNDDSIKKSQTFQIDEKTISETTGQAPTTKPDAMPEDKPPAIEDQSSSDYSVPEQVSSTALPNSKSPGNAESEEDYILMNDSPSVLSEEIMGEQNEESVSSLVNKTKESSLLSPSNRKSTTGRASETTKEAGQTHSIAFDPVDISKLLPPGYTPPSDDTSDADTSTAKTNGDTSATTEKSTKKHAVVFDSVDISKFLPPGYSPSVDTSDARTTEAPTTSAMPKTTKKLPAINLDSVDMSKFLPPGFNPSTDVSESSTSKKLEENQTGSKSLSSIEKQASTEATSIEVKVVTTAVESSTSVPDTDKPGVEIAAGSGFAVKNASDDKTIVVSQIQATNPFASSEGTEPVEGSSASGAISTVSVTGTNLKNDQELANQTSEGSSEAPEQTPTSPPTTLTTSGSFRIRKPKIRLNPGDPAVTDRPLVSRTTTTKRPRKSEVSEPVSIFKRQRTRIQSITSSTTPGAITRYSFKPYSPVTGPVNIAGTEVFDMSLLPRTTPSTTTTTEEEEEEEEEEPEIEETTETPHQIRVSTASSEDDIILLKVAAAAVVNKGIRWRSQLNNRNSPEYIKQSSRMQRTLQRILMDTPVGQNLHRVDIDGFIETYPKSRRIVVDYTVYVIKTSLQVDGALLVRTFNDRLVNNTFSRYLFDPAFTQFQVMGEEKLHKPTEKPDEEPPIPQWAIAVIVIGAASFIFIVLFAAVTVYGRHHMRRRYMSKLDEDLERSVDSREWENKLGPGAGAAYENLAADAIYDAEEHSSGSLEKMKRTYLVD